MFTAAQSAHLKRANALVAIREHLLNITSLVVTTAADAQGIDKMIAEVDRMLAVDCPNTNAAYRPPCGSGVA